MRASVDSSAHGDEEKVEGPLAGTRVVALEHSVAGPLATRILRELGADVLKVERKASGGDFARHWDGNAQGESAQFWWLNRGKRSLALDLSRSDDRAILDALLTEADVFVHNMSVPAARRAGFAADAMERSHPDLVVCQISGYGDGNSWSDRKAYDMLVQAESGIISLTGTSEDACRVGVSICDIASGIYSALLILAGLINRERAGVGRKLDVSMFDVALDFIGPMLTSNLNAGTLYGRSGARHHAIAPYGIFDCADGVGVLLAIEQDGEWRRFCVELMGRPELGDDPRFSTNHERIANRAETDAVVEAYMAGLTSAEATAIFDRVGFAYGLVNDVAAVAAHPVLAERAGTTRVTAGSGAEVEALVGIAERAFGRRPGRMRPPMLDEDRDSVLVGVDSATGLTTDASDKRRA